MIFRGGLFSGYFLEEGIVKTPEYQAISHGQISECRTQLRSLMDKLAKASQPKEAQTELELIAPSLHLLGWQSFTVQQSASRNDVPDYLLYLDEAAKTRGSSERKAADAYKHGTSIVEAKAWGIPLDRGSGTLGEGVPSNQILRYLSAVETRSDRKIRFGILTNGKQWRLYDQQARSRSEDFLGLDLAVLLGIDAPLIQSTIDTDHWLRVFLLMFGHSAFVPDILGQTFHTKALNENRLWESRVTSDLSNVVFNQLFPQLAAGLYKGDPEAVHPPTPDYLASLREAVLTYLYRLLFVLYAEDRDLLPTCHVGYDDYGLSKRVRDDIANRLDKADTLSDRRTAYDDHVRALWKSIDEGDRSIGLPPYNGGLFKPDRSALLNRAKLPDATLAPLLDLLSRRQSEDGPRQRINYRDLNVQHLGSIYERLLEFELVTDATGQIDIRPSVMSRKSSGSYYTPEELVLLVVRRTLKPLLEERLQAFEAKATALKSSREPVEKRLAALAALDPAAAFLDLKVCDPAMGSGHFLVSLVDYLADEVLRATEEAPFLVTWSLEYVSPLLARLAAIRDRIKAQAREHGWQVADDQLEDKQLVRRMIMKRVIYGVDKNPMAVELAKLSLWLHTFTVGAPLSFLDHHLRCGDSLFGEWVRPAMDWLQAKGAGLFISDPVRIAKQATKGMAIVEAITDSDIAEVKASADEFSGVEVQTGPLARTLSFIHALHWISDSERALDKPILAKLRADKKARGLKDRVAQGTYDSSIGAWLDGAFGDQLKIASGTTPAEPATLSENYTRFMRIWQHAQSISNSEQFFSWQVAFPGVWTDWESSVPVGGFDAVVGNPPWDRIKLQEVEWFAARDPAIAHSQRASDRTKMIAELKKCGDALYDQYQIAANRAVSASRVAGDDARYPLLGGGDIDLYFLFVEQAQKLIKANGVMGLLVPIGIATNLGASKFFRGISTSGRLACLLDFQNSGHYFVDVHNSYKITVFVAGGTARNFEHAECAFFLDGTNDDNIASHSFAMSAADFEAVNPNTGTAPIFRSQRDAALTTALYARVPVLVDRRTTPPTRSWPVKYLRMFDMTNDSGLFKSRAELVADGYYPVAGNRLKKAKAESVPLYVGRMIHQFDHRASSVSVNEENLHNAANSEGVSVIQKQSPDFHPEPQYFVAAREVNWPNKVQWSLCFRDIARSTDIRTMIAAIGPYSAYGNKLPLLRDDSSKDDSDYKESAPLVLGNLNSFALDFVARQKVQSASMNWYIVEQLPILPASAYTRTFGDMTAAEIVKREVLHLTYTAHDMTAFARDMGYNGPPFKWDDDDRRHRRARLDALYFHLYGINRDDADYILSTFPIIKREDEAAHGRYLTRDLIMAYMSALAAGDTESVISMRF